MDELNPNDVSEAQYQLLASRRQNYDTMLWQTPVISLTAQAFLFTIALGNGTPTSRVIASFLALISALASAQLLAKHRYFEIHYSRVLESIEIKKNIPPVHKRPPKGHGAIGWSSYTIWQAVFLVFALSAVVAGLLAGLNG